MAARLTGISYEFVFEPDIDSMVKALRLVLEGRKGDIEKRALRANRREPTKTLSVSKNSISSNFILI